MLDDHVYLLLQQSHLLLSILEPGAVIPWIGNLDVAAQLVLGETECTAQVWQWWCCM